MAPVAASGPDSPDPIRVLVVDNVALFRESVAALIDRQEDLAAVGQAANGLEAVELALELRPDVVLLDVEMPVMDGIEAARLIREQNSATRVLMLTVSDREDHLLAAVRLGVQGYLLKDLRPDQLFDMIRAAMRGETPVSPALVTRLMAELRACGQAASAASPPLPEEDLSHRELEVLQLVATGQSNKEIGRALSITEGTVKNHVHNRSWGWRTVSRRRPTWFAGGWGTGLLIPANHCRPAQRGRAPLCHLSPTGRISWLPLLWDDQSNRFGASCRTRPAASYEVTTCARGTPSGR